jgi:diguanylate cyclase (GGDEF)-like protein
VTNGSRTCAGLTKAWVSIAIPLARPLGPKARLRLSMVTAGVAASLLVYVGHATLGLARGGFGNFLDHWLYNGLLVVAAALCAARAVLVRTDRAAWTLLAVALSCWTAGDIYWTLFIERTKNPRSPSPADGFYLAFYPIAYAALALLVRGSVSRLQRSVYLDGLIGAFAASALAVAFVMEPVLRDVGGSFAAVATNVAYPTGDVLFVVIVVGIFVLHGWRPPIAWTWIAIGFATFAAADGIYLHRVAQKSYEVGTALDSLWVVAVAVLAFAAWQPSSRSASVRFEGWRILAFPVLFMVTSIGLLVLGNFRHVSDVALGLAAATLVVVFVRVALTFEEVSALPEARRQAETDELTGLANRRFFFNHLRSAISRAERRSRSLAVLMIDLDRFKELNDTLGHYAGDLLLKQLGPRLKELVRGHESLARLGGDEFALLLPDAQAAEQVARRIRRVLDEPFVINDITVQIEASTGIALYPDHASDADGLLQRADVAMYQAKEEHCDYRLYDPSRDKHSRERLTTIAELRGAIEAGELVLHYQPKSEIATSEVVGVEALVRWMHPARGLIPPDHFIPLAEKTAVMRPLTLFVLEEAIRQCAQWLRGGYELVMSVNVAATNLLDERFTEDVERLLQRFDLPPHYLQLELTENTLMNDPVRAMEVVDALSTLGVEVSLDDFGTGFSSLAYLKQLRVGELKIDRSFVMNMGSDPSDAAIVRSVVDLGKSLGMRVVAEGVEDTGSLAELATLGCDLAQGFWLSRPLPAKELASWLDARGRQPLEAIVQPISAT